MPKGFSWNNAEVIVLLKLRRRLDVSKELGKCKQQIQTLSEEIQNRLEIEQELRSELSHKEAFLKEIYSQIQNGLKLIYQLLNFPPELMRDNIDGAFYANNNDLATFPLEVAAGTELFVQGSSAMKVYLIEKGIVKLIYQEISGKEVIVALRFPGWPLAAVSAVLNSSLPLTGISLTPCYLRAIPAEVFRRLVKSNVNLSWAIHRMFALEINSYVAHLTGIECLSAKQRLEELIWQFISTAEHSEIDKPVRLQLPAKHSEIAQLLAVTPQYVSWLLRQLERESILKRDKGWLVVNRPQNLYHRADLYQTSLVMNRIFSGCFDFSKDVLRVVE